MYKPDFVFALISRHYQLFFISYRMKGKTQKIKIWFDKFSMEHPVASVGTKIMTDFNKWLVNKLGLSCAKLRFSCASQLSFVGQKARKLIQFNPSICYFLDPLDLSNPWTLSANWTLETSWTIGTNECVKPLNQLNCLNPLTNWTIKLIEPMDQLHP